MTQIGLKMAKPSQQDIAAAEELLQVLQLIDARWGGPWPISDAGDDLNELLSEGEQEFDCHEPAHLQTLYNNLAKLLRTAPSFHARVISGMCHVIMYEKNQLLDPDSDCIELHPRFQQTAEECERLRGLMPALPPRPPEGSGLPRYGLRWNGPQQPLTVPMEDGYWTPWHLAAAMSAPTADHSGEAADMVSTAAAVPEGYVLVPVEMTGEMREAFHESYEDFENCIGECPDSQWAAMLAAAPTPEPASPEAVERGNQSDNIRHLTHCDVSGCGRCENLMYFFQACDECGAWGHNDAGPCQCLSAQGEGGEV